MRRFRTDREAGRLGCRDRPGIGVRPWCGTRSPLTDSNRRPPHPSATAREPRARAESRGHEDPANGRDRARTSSRAWTRVPALLFPQSSLGGGPQPPSGRRRIRMRCGSKTATAPASSSSATASRFASRSAACCSGRRFGASTEQDDGRTVGAAGREERGEVGVGRHEDPVVGGRAVEDLLVGCCLKPVVADVYGVVSGCSKLVGEPRRERVVDEEPQPAASGSSRSCTA
jgi:hypothetical protein